MKKSFYLLLVLAVACCFMFTCIPVTYAEDSDSYYYYTISFTTNVEGDALVDDLNIYYSLHGVESGYRNFSLDLYSVDSVLTNNGGICFQPNMNSQTNEFVFRSDKPLIGIRFFQEDYSYNGLTFDKNQYYFELDMSTQKTGLENGMRFEKMCRIEGYGDGGELILSSPMDINYTLKYNASPVVSGVENGATYYTTQKVTVKDKDLVSVSLNGNPVEVFNGEALVTLPGNTNEYYTIIARDEVGESRIAVEMREISELLAPVKGINKDNVKEENIQEITEALNNISRVKENEQNASDKEKSCLNEIVERLGDILEHIEEAKKLKDSENITKVKGITTENVKPEDKGALEKAIADIEKALSKFKGNYKEDEIKVFEKDLNRLREALKVIAPEKEISEAPKTGDDSCIVFESVLFALSLVAILVIGRKKAFLKF